MFMGVRKILVCMAWLAAAVQATELSGAAVTGTHDPSSIMAENGSYYIFSTNNNLNLKASTDLLNWTWAAQPFAFTQGIPAYMATYCAQGTDASPWNLWAPEIVKNGSTYYLYYSRNCPKSVVGATYQEQSILGVATSTSIVGGVWTDQGAVLNVDLNTAHYRVIDPTVVFDQSKRMWVAVGSFGSSDAAGTTNGGIHIFELNPSTGKLLNASDAGTRLAGPWIEAPYITYHAGYYYLFFNQQQCCQGLGSTYYIRVGRSTSITGPYTDKDGIALTNSGGTLFAGLDYDANYSDANKTPSANHGRVGRELGPGHVGMYTTSVGIDIYTYHFYDSTTTAGDPTLGERSMIWGDDGWPRFGWNLLDGVYFIGSALMPTAGAPTGGMFLEALPSNQIIPEFTAWDGSNLQLWKFARVAANQFSITNVQTGLALTAVSGAIRLAAYSATSAFRWTIQQANDRSFALINASTGLALQIPNSTLTPVELGSAAFTNATNQRQWISPVGEFTIKNQWSNMNLAATNNTAASQLAQATVANVALQKWMLVPTLDGYTKVQNVSSGFAMELNGAALADNTTILQKTSANIDAQKWAIEPLPDSSWRLINKASGKVVQTSTQTNGALAIQLKWLSTRNQQWALTNIAQANVVISSSAQNSSSSIAQSSSVAIISSSSATTNIIQHALTGMSLNVVGHDLLIPESMSALGVEIQLYTVNGNRAEYWRTVPGQTVVHLSQSKGLYIVRIRALQGSSIAGVILVE